MDFSEQILTQLDCHQEAGEFGIERFYKKSVAYVLVIASGHCLIIDGGFSKIESVNEIIDKYTFRLARRF